MGMEFAIGTKRAGRLCRTMDGFKSSPRRAVYSLSSSLLLVVFCIVSSFYSLVVIYAVRRQNRCWCGKTCCTSASIFTWRPEKSLSGFPNPVYFTSRLSIGF